SAPAGCVATGALPIAQPGAIRYRDLAPLHARRFAPKSGGASVPGPRYPVAVSHLPKLADVVTARQTLTATTCGKTDPACLAARHRKPARTFDWHPAHPVRAICPDTPAAKPGSAHTPLLPAPGVFPDA